MALDLSGLYDEEEEVVTSQSNEKPSAVISGVPLEVALDDIEEDPDQPRREYSKKSLDDMAKSIEERGVKQPISVKPHPDKPGKYIINFGSRRYRGSLIAKQITIPAFVDEKCNDYDQVIENDQRDNLTPMEMALFIQKKLDEGNKHTAIAKSLGRSKSKISEYLSLIDPPECIEDAYRSGKCTSPRTLYELRQLHKKFSNQVDKWYGEQEEITRNSVARLSDALKGKKDTSGKSVRHDEQKPSSSTKDGGSSGTAAGSKKTGVEPTSKVPSTNDSKNASPDSAGEGGSNETLANTMLIIEFEGRPASVNMNKIPSEKGMLGILFDDGSEAEVEADLCRILHLVEV